MSIQSSTASYSQPLKSNAILVLLLGLAHLFLRLNDVDYGAGIHYPDPVAALLLYLFLWAFPLLNLVLFLRSRKRLQSEARIYGLLSVVFFIGSCWMWWHILSGIAKMDL